EPPARAGRRPVGPDEIGSRVVFARHLREGARMLPTARFGRFEPVARVDVHVHELVTRARDLGQLRKLAHRRVSEEELVRVLYAFFERGLLHLEVAAHDEQPPSIAGSGLRA
ncbi:MAG TPA: hypothetical protein VMV46_22695, partial [Thermoanaerobaculia bacterium]|nr:hypothetical protein [Thermoanaerobaculia bacterium]